MLLEEVRGQEQRPGAPGGQHPDLARDRMGSGTDLRRIPQVAEARRGGDGERREGGFTGAITRRSAGHCGEPCATNATSRGCTWPGSTPAGLPTPALSVASLPTPMLPRPVMLPCWMRVPGCAVLPVAGTEPETMPQRSILRSWASPSSSNLLPPIKMSHHPIRP